MIIYKVTTKCDLNILKVENKFRNFKNSCWVTLFFLEFGVQKYKARVNIQVETIVRVSLFLMGSSKNLTTWCLRMRKQKRK